MAARVRARTSLPVMLTGGFRTHAGMDESLESGATDVVGMARPLAFDPDLPARLLSGEADAATPVQLTTGWSLLDSMIQLSLSFHEIIVDILRKSEIDVRAFSVDSLHFRTASPSSCTTEIPPISCSASFPTERTTFPIFFLSGIK